MKQSRNGMSQLFQHGLKLFQVLKLNTCFKMQNANLIYTGTPEVPSSICTDTLASTTQASNANFEIKGNLELVQNPLLNCPYTWFGVKNQHAKRQS